MMVTDLTTPLRRSVMGVAAMILVSLLAPTEAHAKAPAKSYGMANAPADTPTPPETVLSEEGEGPLNAGDRDLVVKVRLAGLWEVPAGRMAARKSDNAQIVKLAKSIADQHVVLDRLAREAAAKLRIPLPEEPNADQQAWLDEMEAAPTSEAFNQVYIDRLRSAHGKIFPAIANIRANTRNDVVRRLAQQANQFVMTHLTLLESSGLVDYAALSAAATVAPAAAVAGTTPAGNETALPPAESGLSTTSSALLVLFAVGLLVAGLASIRPIMRR